MWVKNGMLYMRGVGKTEEIIVSNSLIKKTLSLPVEQVSKIAQVTVGFVRNVQKKLASGNQ
jgi:hypothetical protein